jgi:phosphohistidine phosphatase
MKEYRKMKLYLIQHGEATTEEVDLSRPLTAKGRSDVQKIASFLKGVGVRPSAILHSGKTRARQTAEILAAQIGPGCQIREREGLAPNDSVHGLLKEVSEMPNDLMIVGHLPFLGKLASSLLTGSEARNLVAFRQGGVVCIQRNEDKTCQLAWMVMPELLK